MRKIKVLCDCCGNQILAEEGEWIHDLSVGYVSGTGENEINRRRGYPYVMSMSKKELCAECTYKIIRYVKELSGEKANLMEVF